MFIFSLLFTAGSTEVSESADRVLWTDRREGEGRGCQTRHRQHGTAGEKDALTETVGHRLRGFVSAGEDGGCQTRHRQHGTAGEKDTLTETVGHRSIGFASAGGPLHSTFFLVMLKSGVLGRVA